MAGVEVVLPAAVWPVLGAELLLLTARSVLAEELVLLDAMPAPAPAQFASTSVPENFWLFPICIDEPSVERCDCAVALVESVPDVLWLLLWLCACAKTKAANMGIAANVKNLFMGYLRPKLNSCVAIVPVGFVNICTVAR